ncbi:MAG: hypothetical protein ACOYCD_05455 [Kiritimatiellia bacterium]|jgi:hypothetical protein
MMIAFHFPTRRHATALCLALLGLAAGLAAAAGAAPFAALDPPASPAGYLVRLLINEVPFPGEKGYISEANTKAAMEAVLWVVHGRLHLIPPGYTQVEIAAVRARDVIDVITAGGPKGQCDGFYRDEHGAPATVPRVEERVRYLLQIANRGQAPGRFSVLLNYAQRLARDYLADGIAVLDRYAHLRRIGPCPVTGRAYSWMTDRAFYNPGGNFVAIPNANQGVLGGNRFYTLRDKTGQP